MDYAFFESLSTEEAQAFLDNFLQVERGAAPDFIAAAKNASVEANYTLDSLPDVMKWVVHQIEAAPMSPPLLVPTWQHSLEPSREDQTDFTDASRVLVLRSAYYFGESFFRSAGLSWSIGSPDTVEKNMPVVVGFRNGVEMAPLMIVSNLFRRILSGASDTHAIERAVQSWRNDVGRTA